MAQKNEGEMMMDYKEKYDEALERAKNFQEQYGGDYAGFIFPELAESEDEKIKQLILGKMEASRKYGNFWSDEEIAWVKKQKEYNGENEEGTDFTIYHPLKNGKGEYECISYSFYGSLTSFSEDKDLIDFLRSCFYTEEECKEWIEQQKERVPENEETGTRKKEKPASDIEDAAYNYANNFSQYDDSIYSEIVDAYKAGAYYMELKQKEPEYESYKKEREIWVENTITDTFPKQDGDFISEEDYRNILRRTANHFYVMGEKQKEPKPAEWSEEDNIGWDEAFACVTRAEKAAKNEEELQNAVAAEEWLKEIKFKYYVHPVKQEWSDEDEYMLEQAIKCVNNSGKLEVSTEEIEVWLKSLRPSWKPTEEQMNSLNYGIYVLEEEGYDASASEIKELYEQLKKLMEE